MSNKLNLLEDINLVPVLTNATILGVALYSRPCDLVAIILGHKSWQNNYLTSKSMPMVHICCV